MSILLQSYTEKTIFCKPKVRNNFLSRKILNWIALLLKTRAVNISWEAKKRALTKILISERI